MVKGRSAATATGLGRPLQSGAEVDFFQGCTNCVEISDAVKTWLDEQDRTRPFGVSWPISRRLELELHYAGFTHLAIAQLAPHPVYIVKGRGGHLGFKTPHQLRLYFRKVARELGFPFRQADTTLICSNGKFRLILVLPTQDNAQENLADDCPFDLDLEDE